MDRDARMNRTAIEVRARRAGKRPDRAWLRRLITVLALTPALVPLPTFPLQAQQIERERQEPIWPSQGVIEISQELRTRLELFPEIQGFRVARLFLRDSGDAVLEIESIRDGRVLRERRILGERELEALRAELAARQAALGTRAVFTREGRGGLVLGHTLIGLAHHGWAIPSALDVNSSQAAVAAYLLTAGASFYIPYRLTRDRSVTGAHRGLSLYGGTRGTLVGHLLGDLVFADPDPGDFSSDDTRMRTRLAVGVLAGVSGGVAGFYAADRAALTEGTASFIGAMGDFGMVSGAVLAWIAGPYAAKSVVRHDGDVSFMEERTRSRRTGHLMTLAGHAAGLGAGAWLSRSRTYSTGDVAVLRSAAILGAHAGLAATRAAGVTDDRSLAAGSLALGLGGIYLGDRLLRDVELTRGEGLLVNAGHLAGGATALGITYLLVEEMDEHPVLYLATSAIGSVVGAGLVWRTVRRDGVQRASPRFSVEVDPTGLLLNTRVVTIRF